MGAVLVLVVLVLELVLLKAEQTVLGRRRGRRHRLRRWRQGCSLLARAADAVCEGPDPSTPGALHQNKAPDDVFRRGREGEGAVRE